jgi:hypothetical protein
MPAPTIAAPANPVVTNGRADGFGACDLASRLFDMPGFLSG